MTNSTRIRIALTSALALPAACSPAVVITRPSLVSHVRDGTPARFVVHPADSVVTGAALGWQRETPRLITTRGDTLTIPRGSKVHARLETKVRHPVTGLLVGWVVGGVILTWNCRGQDICGEQDPTPLIGIAAGTVIGSLVETYKWVRVRWEP